MILKNFWPYLLTNYYKIVRLLIVLLLVFYNSLALAFDNITLSEDVVIGNNYSKSLIGDDYKEYGMQRKTK